MSNTCHNKKKVKGKRFIYFLAIAACTAATCYYVVKEGRRIKVENELLAYEVW